MQTVSAPARTKFDGAELVANVERTHSRLTPIAPQRIDLRCTVDQATYELLREAQDLLGHKMRGHYAYYGITGNSLRLARFRHEVERIWYKWLGRRSRRARMSWERFGELLKRYPLPPARAIHSVLAM